MADLETVQGDSSAQLASLNATERQSWLETGDLPKPESSVEPVPASDESTTVAASDVPLPVEPKSSKHGKPKFDPQARINAITREKADAEARAEAAERKAAELEAKLKPVEPAPVIEPKPPTGEPKLEDFLDQPDPYAALAKATAKYEVEQWKQEQARERSVQAVRERIADIQAEGSEKYPDWNERMASPELQAVTLPRSTVQLLHESEFSVDVLYHLSSHPTEIRALAVMEPLAAAKAIGRIEARLSGAISPPATKTTSSAPEPPRTLGKKPTTPADEADQALRDGDFRRFYDADNKTALAKAAVR